MADSPMPSDWPDLLPYLTPPELEELDKLLSGTGIPLWSPRPGPQTAAYHSPADVLGFGGGGGGGKTDLALGLAINEHHRSLILRREAAKPLRAVIDRAREILQGRGRLNENTGIYRLPHGRQIEFAGCKDIGDEQAFRGRPHSLIFFDEAEQFLKSQFMFICGWLRTTRTDERCRVVLAFNPPSSEEGQWIVDYFAPWLEPGHKHPAQPGELRWYAMIDGKEVEQGGPEVIPWNGERIQPKSRTFIPARYTDNPDLVATGYGATLQALPEPLRSQLLYGDFTVGRQDDAWQVIPTAWVRAAQERWTAERPCDEEGPWRLSVIGVDVAHGGLDQTILARRYRTWYAPLEKHPGTRTPDGFTAAGLVLAAQAESPTSAIHIDTIGWGASAADILRQRVVRGHVWPVNFAASTGRRDRSGLLEFCNLRAFAYWNMRESLDPLKGDGLMLPPDKELAADLTSPRWSNTVSGVKIESKDDIIKRIGRSPDCGDAVVLGNLPVGVFDPPKAPEPSRRRLYDERQTSGRWRMG